MSGANFKKVYVVGVGMSKFIKPRGLVDYPGKFAVSFTKRFNKKKVLFN